MCLVHALPRMLDSLCQTKPCCFCCMLRRWAFEVPSHQIKHAARIVPSHQAKHAARIVPSHAGKSIARLCCVCHIMCATLLCDVQKVRKLRAQVDKDHTHTTCVVSVCAPLCEIMHIKTHMPTFRYTHKISCTCLQLAKKGGDYAHQDTHAYIQVHIHAYIQAHTHAHTHTISCLQLASKRKNVVQVSECR